MELQPSHFKFSLSFSSSSDILPHLFSTSFLEGNAIIGLLTSFTNFLYPSLLLLLLLDSSSFFLSSSSSSSTSSCCCLLRRTYSLGTSLPTMVLCMYSWNSSNSMVSLVSRNICSLLFINSKM